MTAVSRSLESSASKPRIPPRPASVWCTTARFSGLFDSVMHTLGVSVMVRARRLALLETAISAVHRRSVGNRGAQFIDQCAAARGVDVLVQRQRYARGAIAVAPAYLRDGLLGRTDDG